MFSTRTQIFARFSFFALILPLAFSKIKIEEISSFTKKNHVSRRSLLIIFDFSLVSPSPRKNQSFVFPLLSYSVMDHSIYSTNSEFSFLVHWNQTIFVHNGDGLESILLIFKFFE